MIMRFPLVLSTLLVLAATGCGSPRVALSPPDLPFSKQDPRGLDVRWRVARGSDRVLVDGLVTEAPETPVPVKEAMLEVRGLDSQDRVVSWTSSVVYWSDDSGADRTQPFHMRLHPVGTETHFDVVVTSIDYYDWGG
jgi:hypothetical protein